MRNLTSFVIVVLLAVLVVSCNQGVNSATASALSASQPGDAQQVPLLGTSTAESASACSPIPGMGTVAPAISIHTITFLIDGAELTLSNGDVMPASPGSMVRVVEVKICVGPFESGGGEVCVDFAPIYESGEEVSTEHAGTHLVPLVPGFITVPGPDRSWSIDESWVSIAVVVNHWPRVKTEDFECAEGQCERDYRLILPFR